MRLPPRAQAVLEVLRASRGRVVSRRELADRSGLGHLSERRVDQAILVLRRNLGADAIRTVRRRGWMLVGEEL
jgi:DNA-binding winged helix-turn-helix (wHTH) protein